MTEKTKAEMLARIEELEARLHEAEENLNAIRSGGVDALVVSGPRGEQVFTLNDADRPYRIIIEEMNEGTVTASEDGTILYCNKQFAKMLGVSLSKLIGSSLYRYLMPEDHRTLRKILTGHRRRAEVVFSMDDGQAVWSRISFSPLQIDNMPAFCGVITDVTALKDIQKALQASEERYRSILESMEEAYYEVDLKGNLLFCNNAAVRLVGSSNDEIMGMNFRTMMDKQNAEKVSETFRRVYLTGQSEKNIDWELTARDGSRLAVEASVSLNRDAQGKTTGFRGVIHNITDRIQAEEARKKFESQLVHIQKMEAMGRFAGGIAHDLNNILFPIIIDTEFLLEKAAPDTNLYRTLNEILIAAYRQRDLVKQIISFSKGKEQQFMPIKITPLIEEALTFLKASLPSTIKIRKHIDIANDIVLGDSTQIHQIIMNLCKNAADSMEAQKGMIEMELKNTLLDPAFAHPEHAGGRFILLSVKDTGCGIPAEYLDRVFEPFFTTKESGKGSGMGLAVVHGIVKRHNGVITVESEPGKGTRFNVFLPESDVIQAKPWPNDKLEQSVKGKERILLVDDEDIILSSLQRALERTGYEIVAVRDGMEALKIFSRASGNFDLVITDMTMPRMTGIDLAGKLMRIRSDIPIILTTGYSEVIDEQEAKALGIREMLLKPSTIYDLNSAVRRVLES